MVGTKYMDPDPAQSYHPYRIYFYVLSVVNPAYFPGQVARVWPKAFTVDTSWNWHYVPT
jgi:hypothetical protein